MSEAERPRSEIQRELRACVCKYLAHDVGWFYASFPQVMRTHSREVTPAQLAIALILSKARRDPQAQALEKHRRKLRKLAARERSR